MAKSKKDTVKKQWYQKPWFWIIAGIIIVFVIAGVPLIINCLYWFGPQLPNTLFTASDIINYLGAIIGGFGGAAIAIVGVYLTIKNNEKNLDKTLSEQRKLYNEEVIDNQNRDKENRKISIKPYLALQDIRVRIKREVIKTGEGYPGVDNIVPNGFFIIDSKCCRFTALLPKKYRSSEFQVGLNKMIDPLTPSSKPRPNLIYVSLKNIGIGAAINCNALIYDEKEMRMI